MTSSIAALLLADGRLPVGGHAQSGGLEPALQAGMDAMSIPEFLVARLRSAILVDAATASVALIQIGAGLSVDPVVEAWNARVPSERVRAASAELGRGLIRLLKSLGGTAEASRLPRPVAMALLGNHLGIERDELARLICYDDLQSACAAALKLAPCDPAMTVSWVLGCAPEVDRVTQICSGLTAVDDIPAPAAPLAELWQHDHARSTRRLFRA